MDPITILQLIVFICFLSRLFVFFPPESSLSMEQHTLKDMQERC